MQTGGAAIIDERDHTTDRGRKKGMILIPGFNVFPNEPSFPDARRVNL